MTTKFVILEDEDIEQVIDALDLIQEAIMRAPVTSPKHTRWAGKVDRLLEIFFKGKDRMKTRIDAAVLQHQIANLLAQYPELAEDDQLRADMINGETEAFEFLEELERKRREAKRQIDGITPDIAAMSIRQKRFERREQAVRDLMLFIMEMVGIKKHEMPLATLFLRNGPVKVIVTDEHLLTDEYVRIKREADKIKIKQALEDGITVAGAELSNPGRVLSIKPT